MKYGVFPGSFKPPHEGHFQVVKKNLPKVDKFYIIISNKPRGLLKPFDKKLNEFNKKELKNVCKNYKIKKCEKEEIEKRMKKNDIPNVDASLSYKIWEYYIKTLSKKNQEKVKIIIARHPSPVIFSYIILNKILKKGDEIFLLKSKKDKEDDRFSLFKKEEGVKINEVLLPCFKKYSSSMMRKELKQRNKKKFLSYIPDNVEKEEIWKLVRM